MMTPNNSSYSVIVHDNNGARDEKYTTEALQGYPNLPYAAGLKVPGLKYGSPCMSSWQPVWKVFPLKAFRGASFTYIKIKADWDDEALLWELNRTYDNLRTVWRKWFSLRSVR